MNDTTNRNEQQPTEFPSEIELLKAENESLKQEIKKAKSAIPQLEHLTVFNDAVKDVFSEIAHEINNPLNFVMSSVSIIDRGIRDFQELMSRYEALDGFRDNPGYQEIKALEEEIDVALTTKELKDALATINKGFERIQEVVYNLSLLGKQKEATPLKLDLNKSIEDTLFITRGKVGNNIRVITELGKLPLITSYTGKLGQVFINLLQNAIEAIREKYEEDGGEIGITTFADENMITVKISDNGIGMVDEAKEKLFEKFYTTKSPERGTGLGMSVTKDIVDMHKGTISIQSKRGEGTLITLKFPVDH